MEGSVEDGDLRHVFEVLFEKFDPFEIGEVMEGGEISEVADRFFHGGVDEDALLIVTPAVDDAMADHVDMLMGQFVDEHLEFLVFPLEVFFPNGLDGGVEES